MTSWLLQPGTAPCSPSRIRFETVEGNIYFPPDTINREHFTESTHRTVCGWKGEASYYDLRVDGDTNPNGAWSYPRPPARRHEDQGLRGVLERRRGTRVRATVTAVPPLRRGAGSHIVQAGTWRTATLRHGRRSRATDCSHAGAKSPHRLEATVTIRAPRSSRSPLLS